MAGTQEMGTAKDQRPAMTMELTYRGTIYPWHCDHIGHMNIMWYVGKFDEANWNLFARIGLTPTYLRESGCGMAAVQQNITYKRELLAGDIAAICEITGVHMDRQARRSVAFTDAIRRGASSYLADAEAVPA